ncbi:two-component sensor histidine kinase [Nocardia mangyaensis]|uniref:Two-component sensor histidine kinase n=1 Tax=Nocardia mangyaensis TaxID=2213200 RepID=A0A1J0VYZ5_9NOCA|nr:two-component sensor histidine kinase [Nocardia mangyaensis]
MDARAVAAHKLVGVHSSPLTPVVTTLRLGLHVLVTVLAVVVAVRAVVDGGHGVAVVALTAVWLVVYFAGAEVPRRFGKVELGSGRAARVVRGPRTRADASVGMGARSGAMWLWLGVLTVLWLILLAFTPDAVYLAFGLFFLYLHLLPRPWNLVTVVLATAFGVFGFAAHRGWSVGAVIGPVLGAAVAIGIGLGYQALYREAVEREQLIDELISTRAVLADQERTAGKLAERERLAKEIHDTVAQGLSSIQLLLHAAEQAAPDHPALERIQLARQTAAEDLAETRRLIDELSPAALDGQSLADALERICGRAQSPTLATQLLVEGEPERLPMPVEAALVRIAQSAVANVVQHAEAARMRVTLTYADTDVHLDIVDDGVGIDPGALRGSRAFGLAAMRSRVEQQGGAMTVESEPGHTAVTVSFPLGAAS